LKRHIGVAKVRLCAGWFSLPPIANAPSADRTRLAHHATYIAECAVRRLSARSSVSTQLSSFFLRPPL